MLAEQSPTLNTRGANTLCGLLAARTRCVKPCRMTLLKFKRVHGWPMLCERSCIAGLRAQGLLVGHPATNYATHQDVLIGYKVE